MDLFLRILFIFGLCGPLLADETHASGSHWEPQVAMLCDSAEKFINKRMDESGKWVTDWEHKATCIRDKVDILEYCRKVYPDKDITNIVESTEVARLDNWCPINSRKCKKFAQVKPVRCLSGPFQSDALLVPHGCQFDHVHNASQCLGPDAWKVVAEKSCSQRELELRSHAMLLPCGVDVFQGVEFVCCPHDANLKDFNNPNELDEDDDDDDEDDDAEEDEKDSEDADDLDDEDDEDDDEDENVPTSSLSSSTSSTTENPYLSATPDPYLTNFDPENEREEFLAAKERMEKHHEDRVSKVMKDWGVMEEKYQDIKIADPQKAEKYRKDMTAKFQQRVNALEAEGEAEKQQIVSMHQQRILRTINNRKSEALQCYKDALNQRVPSIHKVEKCLQRLLRALHKDRHHTLAHYRHLLNMNFDEAERQREVTFERLMEVDRTVNQSLDMLNKFPELQKKLRPLMDQFADALRTKQNFADSAADGVTFTPNSKLLARTMEAEKETLDMMRDRALTKKRIVDERKRQEEEIRKQKWASRMKKKQEQERIKQKKQQWATSTSGPATSSTEKSKVDGFESPKMGEIRAKKIMKLDPNVMLEDESSLKGSPVSGNHFEDDEEDGKARLHQHFPEEIPVAHAQAHELSHSQSSYSVVPRHESTGSKAPYITVAFAGLALMTVMVLTIVVLRRRNVSSPQNQGFVEVNQSGSPEERHIANMQINGYENPTYKYFEETDTA